MVQTESKSSESKPQPSKRPPASAKAKKPSSGKGLAVLALLIALVSAGGGGYLAYRVEMQHVPQLSDRFLDADALNESIEKLTQRDAQLHDLITGPQDQLSKQFDDHEAALNELRGNLQHAQADLNRKLNESVESLWTGINNQTESDTDAWKIEEIVYLLLFGNERLKISADVQSAALVWRVADEQIDRLGDPRLLDAHSMLKEELKAIEQIKPVDLGSVSNQLFSLLETVDTLPTRDFAVSSQEEQMHNEPADDNSPNVPEKYFGERFLGEIWQDLKSLVIVRKIDETSLPPISPSAAPHLIQNIKLALFAAQIAALRSDEVVFLNNLKYVQNAAQDYLQDSSPEVKQFLGQVNDLARTPVSLNLPDLSGSLTELQDVLSSTEANG